MIPNLLQIENVYFYKSMNVHSQYALVLLKKPKKKMKNRKILEKKRINQPERTLFTI